MHGVTHQYCARAIRSILPLRAQNYLQIKIEKTVIHAEYLMGVQEKKVQQLPAKMEGKLVYKIFYVFLVRFSSCA